MVQRTDFDIIQAFYPDQANTVYNLLIDDERAFKALYPDLFNLLNAIHDRPANPNHHDRPAAKNPNHHESCPCSRCRPELTKTAPVTAPDLTEVRRKRACTVTMIKPTAYREGFFETRPVKDFGAMPRWAEFITNKSNSNGWAWGAVAFGKATFFETYLPLSCVGA